MKHHRSLPIQTLHNTCSAVRWWGRTDGGVVDVVVGGDHAQVERPRVHVVHDGDALGVLQVRERGLHEVGEVVREVAVGHALESNQGLGLGHIGGSMV